MPTISQIDLFAAIMRHLDRREGIKECTPRQANAVIEASNLIVDAFAREHQEADAGSGLAAWLRSDSTGLSSMAMARRLAPLAGLSTPVPEPGIHWVNDRNAHPHDPADFARCLTLLAAEPSLRPHLPAMADASPEWAALVGAWGELEALYAEEHPRGKGPKLYRRMKELIDGASKGWSPDSPDPAARDRSGAGGGEQQP